MYGRSDGPRARLIARLSVKLKTRERTNFLRSWIDDDGQTHIRLSSSRRNLKPQTNHRLMPLFSYKQPIDNGSGRDNRFLQ
jgi:hypothetical protein